MQSLRGPECGHSTGVPEVVSSAAPCVRHCDVAAAKCAMMVVRQCNEPSIEKDVSRGWQGWLLTRLKYPIFELLADIRPHQEFAVWTPCYSPPLITTVV